MFAEYYKIKNLMILTFNQNCTYGTKLMKVLKLTALDKTNA